MNNCKFLFILAIFFGTCPTLFSAEESEAPEVCDEITVKAPPLIVVPTGYDAKNNQDDKLNRNYKEGNTNVENNKPTGDRFIVPKRSLVQVSTKYKDLIEKEGKFVNSKGNEWVLARVVSLPPENKKLQETTDKKEKNIAKNQNTVDSKEAEIGSIGYLKIADLELLEKQQDYVFIVKRDSELFTQINDYINLKNYTASEPFALRFKENETGYRVNQCCPKGSNDNCKIYPIFEVLHVVDKKGEGVELYKKIDCFLCLFKDTNDLVPIEDHNLTPLRRILSHPTFGLTNNTSNLGKIADISDLNFIDSRGFVQIPIRNNGSEKIGPFNSVHNHGESNDADVYLKPDVLCGFMQVLKTWDSKCNGKAKCRIEFHDASHAYYKDCSRNKDGKCAEPWPHTDHNNGTCLDIGTDQMDPDELVKFVTLLNKLGIKDCFSNVAKLKNSGCNPLAGHDAHMHFCIPSNGSAFDATLPNPKLKKACEQGVSP